MRRVRFTAWSVVLAGVMAIAANSYAADGDMHVMGKLGVGTESPDQKLTVKGGGIGFDGTSVDKKLYSPVDGTLEWMTHDAAAEHGFSVSHQGQRRVYLNTLGDSYLIGGNVGIGTTNPTALLDSNGVIRSSSLGSGSPASGVGIEMWFMNNAGYLLAYDRDNSVNKDVNIGLLGSGVLVRADGNVGIGTASPQAKLDVAGVVRCTDLVTDQATYADYVFEPDYKLESIEEHAEFMWERKHLRAIPARTIDADTGNEIMSLPKQTTGIVEELEKAHIYIAQLNKRIEVLEEKIEQLNAKQK